VKGVDVMRVRSTGLGKMEMVAEISKLEHVGNGFFLVEMRSTEPVHWKIRVALTGADFRHLIGIMLKKPLCIFKVCGRLFQGKNDKKPPEF
jgi:hypothetical protein